MQVMPISQLEMMCVRPRKLAKQLEELPKPLQPHDVRVSLVLIAAVVLDHQAGVVLAPDPSVVRVAQAALKVAKQL
jgi:hypothetical protein